MQNDVATIARGQKYQRPDWDHDGAYLSAATKLIRAKHAGRGTNLTEAEVGALCFAEGDGDWFQGLLNHLLTEVSNHER